MQRFHRIAILSVVVILITVISSYVFREQLLSKAGEFLLFEGQPEKVDLIVVLRGGKNFERLLTAFELYKSGYGNRIYISRSLGDNASSAISKFGIHIPSNQEQMGSILKQLNVPAEDIILDDQKAGGGTLGEARRVRKVVSKLKLKKIIVVTSWYHTRRTRLIYSRVFSNTGVQCIIVAAKQEYSKSSPSNWWKYRYQAMYVLQEFPKVFLAYLDLYSWLKFRDDPT